MKRETARSLCNMLAARLAKQGLQHPHVAAAVIACRGLTDLTHSAFALRCDITTDQLADLEAGAVALTDVPSGVAAAWEICGLNPNFIHWSFEPPKAR